MIDYNACKFLCMHIIASNLHTWRFSHATWHHTESWELAVNYIPIWRPNGLGLKSHHRWFCHKIGVIKCQLVRSHHLLIYRWNFYYTWARKECINALYTTTALRAAWTRSQSAGHALRSWEIMRRKKVAVHLSVRWCCAPIAIRSSPKVCAARQKQAPCAWPSHPSSQTRSYNTKVPHAKKLKQHTALSGPRW